MFDSLDAENIELRRLLNDAIELLEEFEYCKRDPLSSDEIPNYECPDCGFKPHHSICKWHETIVEGRKLLED